MNYIKRTFYMFIFCMLTLALYPQNIDVVIYGDENYPPYSYVENGIFKGIYTEIIREAAKEIEGYNVELKPVPWRRGLKLIENGGLCHLSTIFSACRKTVDGLFSTNTRRNHSNSHK